jgi:hypothetical protein
MPRRTGGTILVIDRSADKYVDRLPFGGERVAGESGGGGGRRGREKYL